MGGVFLILGLIFYLAFLVNWKDLRNVLRQGGWAALVVYAVVAVLIVTVLATPDVVVSSGGQH